MKEAKYILIKLFLLFLFLAFTSCGKTVYVPVEKIKTEYINQHTRDSVYLRDSIYFYHNGDTVKVETFRTLYKDRLIKDSVIIRDTIPFPYEVKVLEYKDKPLSWWQSTCMRIGEISIFSILICLGIWAFKVKRNI